MFDDHILGTWPYFCLLWVMLSSIKVCETFHYHLLNSFCLFRKKTCEIGPKQIISRLPPSPTYVLPCISIFFSVLIIVKNVTNRKNNMISKILKLKHFQTEANINELMNTLECPVCLDTADQPPIYQCPSGHLLCESCNQRLVDCPQCGHALMNSRNRTAEDLAMKLQV